LAPGALALHHKDLSLTFDFEDFRKKIGKVLADDAQCSRMNSGDLARLQFERFIPLAS
jgi:hypothetical protein